MLNGARSAQSGSQTERKVSTSNHDAAALRAATFILITTISPVAKGRTAWNGGSERLLDQKSGLEKPLPTGAARITGMAKVHPRTHKALSESFRITQERGPITRISIAPM